VGKKIPYVLENSVEKLEDNSNKISGPKNDLVTLRKTIKQNDINLKITLPLAVTDQKNVKVSLKNGILSIFIDKEAENKNSFSVKIDEN
jgi:HSP20 family molecular chaperone IbpA